jgi:hypothetical protein
MSLVKDYKGVSIYVSFQGEFYKTERKTHSSLLRGWDVSDKCS